MMVSLPERLRLSSRRRPAEVGDPVLTPQADGGKSGDGQITVALFATTSRTAVNKCAGLPFHKRR
jgi:hypothetical protein